MPRIKYVDVNFRESTLARIQQANEIIEEYREQGFDLTLRQLYYQFVARDLIPNREREYKKLGSIVNDARLAGMIDWNSISDRTRSLRKESHWEDPSGIIKDAASQFALDKWKRQPNRVEVWIEKDALVGILESICPSLDVPFFSCRGYTSQSEMWRAAGRLLSYGENQRVVILHLGDHDPSGIDMSRDIEDRLSVFGAWKPGDEFRRIALNMNQIEEFSPPPNPAKVTDSRFESYVRLYGPESWELDSLEPTYLAELVTREIEMERSSVIWEDDVDREEAHKKELKLASRKWNNVRDYLQAEAELDSGEYGEEFADDEDDGD